MSDDLVPINQVLEDMYEDKGLVSLAARDYYYVHYATDEERKRIDREDKIHTAIGVLFLLSVPASIILALIFR